METSRTNPLNRVRCRAAYGAGSGSFDTNMQLQSILVHDLSSKHAMEILLLHIYVNYFTDSITQYLSITHTTLCFVSVTSNLDHTFL